MGQPISRRHLFIYLAYNIGPLPPFYKKKLDQFYYWIFLATVEDFLIFKKPFSGNHRVPQANIVYDCGGFLKFTTKGCPREATAMRLPQLLLNHDPTSMRLLQLASIRIILLRQPQENVLTLYSFGSSLTHTSSSSRA